MVPNFSGHACDFYYCCEFRPWFTITQVSKNQRVKRHESFMKRQRIVAEGQVPNPEETLDKVEQK